jgi:hypothetical protein
MPSYKLAVNCKLLARLQVEKGSKKFCHRSLKG